MYPCSRLGCPDVPVPITFIIFKGNVHGFTDSLTCSITVNYICYIGKKFERRRHYRMSTNVKP